MGDFKTRKLIEVPVVIGKGEGQFFVEKELCITPPCPPVYMVKEIKKWIDVYDATVIPGKVLFNACLWKDINYKTVEKACNGFVSGPVYHYTTKIPFGGFVEINCGVKPGDKAELLEAKIEGERDNWQGACLKQGVKVYNKLVEKTVIKLKFKVVRIKELCVNAYPPLKEKEPDFSEKKDDCDYNDGKDSYDNLEKDVGFDDAEKDNFSFPDNF